MLKFKRDIGFGAFLKKMVNENPQIIFIALQDSTHILAASGRIDELKNVKESDFLLTAMRDSSFITRKLQINSFNVFEAVHPFVYENEMIGIFRLGLSLKPLQDINERIYRRLAIITIILIIIGFMLFVYIFTRQRLGLLQRQYEVVETYSGNIINNVSDAIIVMDEKNGIKKFNNEAENLFLKSKSEILGKDLTELFSVKDSELILNEKSMLNQFVYKIGEQHKYLLISKSSFKDHDENENLIFVIRDLTEQKVLEAQLERQKRLTAMGELASGIAHEIRNPLNAIGTIVQQLDKDFEPVKDTEEYHDLAGLVYNEVKRINDTVQEFLRFARPEPIQPSQFEIKILFEQLEKQYRPIAQQSNIDIDFNILWNGEVYLDKKQIKQMLINLIQNAIESVMENGIIMIRVEKILNQEIEIRIKDNGKGIPEKIRSNIFNLYFTTKATGTGIGLSIVQRIIYEHEGTIFVESEPGNGAEFIIKLPVRLKPKTA
jgi:PAS domain S-box-containing protein